MPTAKNARSEPLAALPVRRTAAIVLLGRTLTNPEAKFAKFARRASSQAQPLLHAPIVQAGRSVHLVPTHVKAAVQARTPTTKPKIFARIARLGNAQRQGHLRATTCAQQGSMVKPVKLNVQTVQRANIPGTELERALRASPERTQILKRVQNAKDAELEVSLLKKGLLV